MDVEDLIASMHVGREGYELKALQVSTVESRSTRHAGRDAHHRPLHM
jgi:hypothetical protein